MSFVRHWWRQSATSVALGLTLWLSLGTLAITDAQTVRRVWLLPPFWTLGLTGLLGIIAGFWHSTRHRWLLLLPAVLMALPWLPASAYLGAGTFIWQRPLVTLVWAVVAIAWLVDTGVARDWPRVMQHPVQGPFVAGLCALVLFLAGAARLAPWLPGGDEPHYLVITQSLLYDGDLRIENNHRAQQYRQYLDRDLRPDYLRRGVDNQIYSVHAPGLPALILPAFAIGGYRGAQIFLALIAAIGSMLVWRVCWLVTGRVDAAWLGWAAMTGSVPVFFHAFAIYPDGVAAVLVLSGVLALLRTSEVTTWRAGLHGAALALLPWLHTRFALLAAALGLVIVARLWRRWGAIAAFLAIPLISAIGWFALFHAIYGEFNPAAPYGSTMQGSWETLPGGIVGLLIDQQFGLLTNAPVFIVALVGLGWMLSRRDRLAIEIAIITVPYALATAAYPMWWGGWSAPARFLVPVLLLGSIPIAVLWSNVRTHTTRALVGVAVGLTLWLTLFMLTIHRGRIVYNDRDGYALWADWAGPVADLATGLPSLFRGTVGQALACAAIWAIAIIAAWLLLRRIERGLLPLSTAQATQAATDSGVEQRTLWMSGGPPLGPSDVRPARGASDLFSTALAPAICGVAAMIAFTAAWRLAGVSGWRPEVSQLRLVQQVRGGDKLPEGLSIGDMPERRGTNPFRPLAQAIASGSAHVFAVNDGVYLEPGGFWLEPAIDHTLLIASTASSIKLALRNTPVENRVTVTIDRWRKEVTLAPNEQVEIEAPAARGGRSLMRIRVANGVRPADLDPRSSDRRLLGLWVELR